MADLFTQLQVAKAEQEQQLVQGIPPSTEPRTTKKEVTQKITQKPTQINTQVSKRLSKRLSNLPSSEEVENFVFQLRKIPKVRANADIPQEWKKRLDDAAYELGVGKYDLLMYIIADFLGELEPKE